MVEYGRHTQRTHGRDEHGAMERADFFEFLRQEAEIIHRFQEPDRKLQQKPRHIIEEFGRFVKIALIVGFGKFHFFFDELVYLRCRCIKLRADLDDGFKRIGTHFTLDREVDRHAVARINLLPRNKAVHSRLLREAAHIGRDEHMHDAEAGKAVIIALMADVAFDLIDVDGVHEMVRGGVPRDHDIGGNTGKRIERTQFPPIVPVAPAALAFCGFYGLFLFHWLMTPYKSKIYIRILLLLTAFCQTQERAFIHFLQTQR